MSSYKGLHIYEAVDHPFYDCCVIENNLILRRVIVNNVCFSFNFAVIAWVHGQITLNG